jgi:hypothetical protein
MKILFRLVVAALAISPLSSTAPAQVPQLVNYQGRVAVGSLNFTGSGQFKFALVNTNGSTTYWSNDGTSTAGSQPTAAVTLTVTNGLYSVLLGDTSHTNMTAIPASVWANADVRLRVWFNDGTNGSQLLSPDQRLAPNGYLPAGSVTSAALASGSVGSADIAPGSVGTTQLAAGAQSAPVTISGATQTAVANTAYTTTGSSNTIFTLPATANVGDVVQITAAGTAGWSAGVWTLQSGSPTGSWHGVAASADATHLVAVTSVSTGQIYTSSDSGVTWFVQSSGLPAGAVWLSIASSYDGTHLAACNNNGGVYTSTNSGAAWTQQTSGLPASTIYVAIVSSANGMNLAVAANNVSEKIYTSTNAGQTWSASGAPSENWGQMASDSTGQYLIASFPGGGNGQIWTSANAGTSWTQQTNGLPTPVQWNSVASSADGTRLVAVASNGQICTSNNSGATWTPQAGAPSVQWNSVASSADGTHLAVGAQGDSIYLSADSGVTWVKQNLPVGTYYVASSADGTHLVATKGSAQIYTYSAFSGASGTTTTLQYLGNGLWGAVTPTLNATTTIPGDLDLPATTSASAGVINLGGSPFLQAYGPDGSSSTNTFVGLNAGNFTLSGGQNTGLGAHALSSDTTGLGNTAIGLSALNSNTTGTANIAIGYQAGLNLTTGNNNIDIGSPGVAAENTTVRIGTQGVHTAAYIAGISGATASGGVAVFVNANGQLGTLTSSRRFKRDIADMDQASEAILSLRPVTFRYKPELDAQGVPQFGLIAEEVNEIAPGLVARDAQGAIYTVRYEAVNAMLLNEFLKDHRRAREKDAEIAKLKERLAELEAKDKVREERLTRLENALSSISVPLVSETAAAQKGD